MFRKKFPLGRRAKPETRAALMPVPVTPAEPAQPAAAPVLPKDIVAPSARRVAADAQARAPRRTLVVGRDIVLSGEIESCEKLIIEGRVEGDIADTKRLEIAETGRFKGTAVVEECLVAGACEGELTVNGLLSVRAKGRVGGTVRYVEVEVQRGGRLTGDVDAQAVREIASQAEPEAEAAAGATARAPEGAPGSG